MAGEQTGTEESPGSPDSPGFPGSQAKSEAEAGKAGADRTEPGVNDLKRKFREALDRKRDQQAHASAEAAHGTGRVHDAHGRAPGRRSFRRKSG